MRFTTSLLAAIAVFSMTSDAKLLNDGRELRRDGPPQGGAEIGGDRPNPGALCPREQFDLDGTCMDRCPENQFYSVDLAGCADCDANMRQDFSGVACRCEEDYNYDGVCDVPCEDGQYWDKTAGACASCEITG